MGASPPLRLATRGSPLARWQADRVAALLAGAGHSSVVVVVETEGDRRTDVPLARLGGTGVFVKEVQAALVRGDADLAVHSAKDLPADPRLAVPGLAITACPERADPRDVLVGGTLSDLAPGARVATGSARRRAQLAALRPDLTFTDLRGNLATRLAVAGRGGVAAVVVAKAALDRMGWEPPPGTPVEVLGTTAMVPQVGQGVLAVECVADSPAAAAVAALDDPAVHAVLEAERAFLAELGGGCTLPVGAHAVRTAEGRFTCTGMVATAGETVVLRATASGDDPRTLGRAVARSLREASGGDIPGAPGTGDIPGAPGTGDIPGTPAGRGPS